METEREERRTYKRKATGENGMIAELFICIFIYFAVVEIYHALESMFEVLY